MHLVAYCREGFERDCEQELVLHARRLQIEIKFSLRNSYLISNEIAGESITKLRENLPFNQLIFPRQIIFCMPLNILGDDRVTPIVETAKALLAINGANAYSNVYLETPDTNDGKSINSMSQKIKPILDRALNKARLLPKGPGARKLPRLNVFFESYEHFWVGFSDPNNSSPWPMGIPRLKFPPDAPSRSTLKLEEAFLLFLTDEERQKHLQPGMTAVDLGSSPGGWTYQLVRRGISVTAIDNGAMDERLLASGLVTHLKADALTYYPNTAVDWLVCDVVEQPKKIAAVIGRWISQGFATRAIFNLKLPMKTCWEEIQSDLEVVRSFLPDHTSLTLRAKQLYHDRKEVTIYLGPAS